MKDLYAQTTFGCSKLITKKYSTSFSLGIQTLHKDLHDPIYAIYGFVRYADEIVDTFHDFNKKELLDRFSEDTFKAIEEGISLNPVLHSFQQVVNEYNIDHGLIKAFLFSMELDLEDHNYDQSLYEKYIYGSAEVVGLMCLWVFVKGDKKEYNRLEAPAKALGAAFQKVNFLRDMRSDFYDRGRVYFPGVDFNKFTDEIKKDIEADIQKDFDHAHEGIVELPEKAKAGVYLAYIYYLKLFKKIKKSSSKKVLAERIRVPDFRKIVLLLSTYFRIRLDFI